MIASSQLDESSQIKDLAQKKGFRRDLRDFCSIL